MERWRFHLLVSTSDVSIPAMLRSFLLRGFQSPLGFFLFFCFIPLLHNLYFSSLFFVFYRFDLAAKLQRAEKQRQAGSEEKRSDMG